MVQTDKDRILEVIDRALDNVRPHLKVDGGDVEVVDITDDNLVKVKWLGNCRSCNMSHFTMKAGIEQTIRSVMPEISGVEAVN